MNEKTTLKEQDILLKGQEQISNLLLNCKLYDEGKYTVYTQMSALLYQFLHDSRNSKSILSQLKLLDKIEFFATGNTIESETLGASKLSSVCCLQKRQNENPSNWDHFVSFSPIFSSKIGEPVRCQLLTFSEWWSETIVVMPNGSKRGPTFTRRELTMIVSDNDGGRHTDPKISRNYHKLMKENWLGFTWMFLSPELKQEKSIQIEPMGVIHATLRQISHEFLFSILRSAPCLFSGQDYLYPAFGRPQVFYSQTDKKRSLDNLNEPMVSATEWLKFYAFIPGWK